MHSRPEPCLAGFRLGLESLPSECLALDLLLRQRDGDALPRSSPCCRRKLGEEAKRAAADAVISKEFQEKVAEACAAVGTEAVAALKCQVICLRSSCTAVLVFHDFKASRHDLD